MQWTPARVAATDWEREARTLLGGLFAALFLIAAARGQFDDLDDPPERILHD